MPETRRGVTLGQRSYLKAFDRMLAGDTSARVDVELAVRVEDMADERDVDPSPDRARAIGREQFLDRVLLAIGRRQGQARIL